MKKKTREKITTITIENNICPIPLESLQILVTGDSNSKFKVVNKKITSTDVKVKLKHRESSERVHLSVPREFLDSHKIKYKEAVVPSDLQIVGVLEDKVKAWTIKEILTDLSDQFALVIVQCNESGKLIGCKTPYEVIQNTKKYIDSCKNYKLSTLIDSKSSKVNLWRETEWQREVQVRLSLSALTHSTILPKV